MSGSTPDRKEETDAPDSARNPWVTWLGWLFLFPVLYVLSTGPVTWLVEKHHLPEETMVIYTPLRHLPSDILLPIVRYAEWWAK